MLAQIVGNTPDLGNWVVGQGPSMTWTEGEPALQELRLSVL